MKRTPLRRKAKKKPTLTIYEKNVIRFNVLQRDGGLCFRTKFLSDFPPKGCTGVALELHHIIPRSRPFKDLWHEKNLIFLCTHCHSHYGQTKLFREACLRKLKQLYDFDYSESPFCEYVN